MRTADVPKERSLDTFWSVAAHEHFCSCCGRQRRTEDTTCSLELDLNTFTSISLESVRPLAISRSQKFGTPAHGHTGTALVQRYPVSHTAFQCAKMRTRQTVTATLYTQVPLALEFH